MMLPKGRQVIRKPQITELWNSKPKLVEYGNNAVNRRLVNPVGKASCERLGFDSRPDQHSGSK